MVGDASSAEEWQREARRLELQGKQEQAEAIRKNVLREQGPPWRVLDRERFADAARSALDPACVSSKLRRQLLEYAAVYEEHDVADRLEELGFTDRLALAALSPVVRRKHQAGFDLRNPKDALRLVDQYGVDYRSPFNFTPLMLAAEAGNLELARTLIGRGADPDQLDNAGRNALHVAIARANGDPAYGQEALPGLWSLLAPPNVSLRLDEQLVKIDAHLIEYVLFQVMYALLRAHLCTRSGWRHGMRSGDLLEAADALPPTVLRWDRRRRDYLSGVLARNEVGRDYAYNRRLFLRLSYGRYVLNPRLELRLGEGFVPVYDTMGVRQMAELGLARHVEALALIDDALADSRDRRPEARM